MQNLWGFLFRNRVIVWFLIFEVLCFFLILKYNPYQGGLYLNSSNRLIGGIYTQKQQIESFLYLRTVNRSLAEENAKLRMELKSSQYSNTLIKGKVRDTLFQQEYSYLVADVVNNTTTRRNNYLTLNKGSLAGVKPGNGVIFPQGIVGVVKDVSSHFCTVLSILHSESRSSVRIRHSKNIGSLFWDGVNSEILSVKDIPNYVDVKKGDTIETSRYSFFPEGIPIGRVLSAVTSNGESALSIQIKLLSDLNKLDQVYIVKDKLALEKQTLENVSEK